MTSTLIVEYLDINNTVVTITLTGPDPTLTVTNTSLATGITDSVVVTVLTNVLISTTTTFTSGTPDSQHAVPTVVYTLLPDTLTPYTTLPRVQLIGSSPIIASPSSPSIALSKTTVILPTSLRNPATAPANASNTTATAPTNASNNTAASSPPACPSHCPSAALSPGGSAGVAVGCLIVGALVAGIVFWLFMSSRQKKQRSRGGFAKDTPSTSHVVREKSFPTAPIVAGVTAAGGQGWEQHLPQSESDGTVRTSVKALFDQIELHVENFYRNVAVSISPEIQSRLMQVDSSYLPDSVVGLITQTKMSTLLIKHCLAQLIVSRITIETDTTSSFLPTDFVALPRAMGGTRTNGTRPAFAQALSRWRVLTSYLRPRPQDDRTYIAQRDTNITSAANMFCTAFAPWAVSPNDHEGRRQHLMNLMKAAADAGIIMFSQPSSFAFRWTVPNERDRQVSTRIVVLPGFAKVTDEHARDLGGRAQELLAPVVGTL